MGFNSGFKELTSALNGGGWSTACPAALAPGKSPFTRYVGTSFVFGISIILISSF